MAKTRPWESAPAVTQGIKQEKCRFVAYDLTVDLPSAFPVTLINRSLPNLMTVINRNVGRRNAALIWYRIRYVWFVY